MIITNKYGLPQALVDIVKADEREHDPKSYGVTTVLKPTREILLKRRHEKELEVDVADCVNRLFGTAFHGLIEKHDKTGMSELTLSEKILDDYKLVGKLDLYNAETESVIDYKTATCWKIIFKDFEDWKKQGLLYAWLCLKNGYIVKKITFYAFLKDWTAREKRQAELKGSFYPDAQIYTYEFEVRIGDLMEIEDWLTKKFENLAVENLLADDELTPCSKEECWYSGDQYAVYKNATDARAQRVFDTKEEADGYLAEKMAGKGVVVYREGVYRKCQDYCEVCNFCKYYKERGGK